MCYNTNTPLFEDLLIRFSLAKNRLNSMAVFCLAGISLKKLWISGLTACHFFDNIPVSKKKWDNSEVSSQYLSNILQIINMLKRISRRNHCLIIKKNEMKKTTLRYSDNDHNFLLKYCYINRVTQQKAISRGLMLLKKTVKRGGGKNDN